MDIQQRLQEHPWSSLYEAPYGAASNPTFIHLAHQVNLRSTFATSVDRLLIHELRRLERVERCNSEQHCTYLSQEYVEVLTTIRVMERLLKKDVES